MSDREFDNYLTLLAGLLRLDGKQRRAIAQELQSHLEDRLEELVERGVSREEAIETALAEFGDAAGLAGQFTRISWQRKRRWLMRMTTFSVAAMVLLAAGLAIFWPGRNAAPGVARAVAQNVAATPAAPVAEASPVEPSDNKLAEALNRRIDVDFQNVPLREVVAYLTKSTGVTFHLQARKLEEASVSLDTPITSTFNHVRLRTWLDLALADLELTYVEKDDLIVITTPEAAEASLHIRVYDCRDLLAMVTPGEKRPPNTFRPTNIAPTTPGTIITPLPGASAPAAATGSADSGTAIALPGTSRKPPERASEEARRADDLIELVTSIVQPDSWDDVGGPGAIDVYSGLVVVAQTDEVHKRVERLFDMLREAAGLEVSKTGKVVK